jgi:hypothetical protein
MDRRRVRRDDGNGATLHEEEKPHHVELFRFTLAF